MIKGSRFVNQVVLIGDGRKFPAALIVPDWEQLESYAKFKGLDLRTRGEFCQNPRIIDLFERQIAGAHRDTGAVRKDQDNCAAGERVHCRKRRADADAKSEAAGD